MDAHPFIGIDVSKERLDIGVGAEGDFWQAANDEPGIQATLTRLAAVQPALVVVESTGGLEWPLVSELAAGQIPVALVNPGRVREFAKSLGLLAKTDKLDAHLLARFGQAAQLSPTVLPDTQRSRSFRRSWPAGGNCWRCWSWRRTICSAPA